MYQDLLLEGNKKILDVGGGISALTNYIASKNEYYLLDILSHDKNRVDEYFLRGNLVQKDWYDFSTRDRYDVIVANDLFPNVDQRLEIFLNKFLPSTKEIRLSLTYYPNNRFYHVKRLDAEENLCFLAWDGEQTARLIQKYDSRISNINYEIFDASIDSVFENQRQVCIVTINGDA